jgi:DNA-binding NarL/FixJ family response regulator
LSDQRATLAQARQAYFDGEFERCLVLCDAVRSNHDATRFEVAMLRARVHVRLDRGDRALEALRIVAFTALSVDEFIAATMLTGAAYVRLGQKQRGESILAGVMEKAADANPTVRAELALQLGIAKFRLGEFEEADRLCAGVPSDADVIYANALEYRGWAAHARYEAAAASQWFRETLRVLATCRRRDRYVEAAALYGLAGLCPELMLTEDWPVVEARLRTFDWSASGLARWRFWVALAASMMCETTGDVRGARNWAQRAENSVESPGHRVVVLCRLAAVFRGLGELNAHAEFVERAAAVYDTVDVRDLGADLQQLPLFLAEEVAYTKAGDDAERLVAQYRQSISPELKNSSGGLVQYGAMERLIEAIVYESRGNTAHAVRAFTAAYRAFVGIGYQRRAAAIALRLARLTGKERYVEYAASALRGSGASFWMCRDLREMRNGSGPTVTETEMAVLRLIVHGKTYKEIAAVRRSSAKTVGNHVQSLFRKFGVNSRGELTAAALHQRTVVLQHEARPLVE